MNSNKYTNLEGSMDNFIEELSDISIVEKQPSLEGNTMYCIMGPKRNK